MAVEIRVPALGESIVDAVVANWLKHEGDTISQGEALVELETDKINVDVPAEQSGVLQKIEKQEGDVVSVGDVLGLIGESAAAPTSTDTSKPEPVAAPVATPEQMAQAGTSPEIARTTSGPLSPVDSHRPPSPLARRIAAEHHVDLSQVRGNSTHGRVTKDDVINYLEQGKSGQLPSLTPTPAPANTRPAPAPLLVANAAQREERVRLCPRFASMHGCTSIAMRNSCFAGSLAQTGAGYAVKSNVSISTITRGRKRLCRRQWDRVPPAARTAFSERSPRSARRAGPSSPRAPRSNRVTLLDAVRAYNAPAPQQQRAM